jgi:ribosomal protein L11 methyltransferase
MPDERFAELVIDAPADLAELVAAFVAYVGDGVEVRDAETLLRPAAADRVELVAYVRPEQAEGRIAELHGRFAGLQIASRLRDEAEWRDVWKQFFKPRRIGARLVVRPSWERYQAQPGEQVIELDPGRAFGTGGHESTRLCIQLMEDLPAPRRFLDVGTGSGILSIATAALWPGATGLALDVDPDAIACALENFDRNHLGDRVAASGAVVADVGERFDLVLANLTAETLLELHAQLAACVGLGGRIILSGLLRDFADPVAARFTTVGLSIERMLDEGEWRAARLFRAG